MSNRLHVHTFVVPVPLRGMPRRTLRRTLVCACACPPAGRVGSSLSSRSTSACDLTWEYRLNINFGLISKIGYGDKARFFLKASISSVLGHCHLSNSNQYPCLVLQGVAIFTKMPYVGKRLMQTTQKALMGKQCMNALVEP